MSDTPLSAERLAALLEVAAYYEQHLLTAGEVKALVTAAQQAESLRTERDLFKTSWQEAGVEVAALEAEVSRLRAALTRSHYVRPNEGEAE